MTKKQPAFVVVLVLIIFLGVHAGDHILFLAQSGYSFLVTSCVATCAYIKSPFYFLYDRFCVNQERLARIDDLERQYNFLLQEHISLMGLCAYSKETKELLDFKKKHMLERAIPARIMLRSCSDRAHTVTINAGSFHGIAEEMVVFVHNNLLGKVSSVYPFHAVVTLITDRTCKVACCCFETKTKGIHEGVNGLHGVLSYVNPLDPIKEGDYVLSTGQGMVFPQGLLLGTIQMQKDELNMPFVTVQTMLHIDEIEHCLVASRADLETIFH